MKILNVEIIKTKSEKVKARIDVHFDGFWLKGFKVLFNEAEKRNYITPPSYQAGVFWRPLFKTDSPDEWKDIQSRLLAEFDNYQLEESTKDLPI